MSSSPQEPQGQDLGALTAGGTKTVRQASAEALTHTGFSCGERTKADPLSYFQVRTSGPLIRPALQPSPSRTSSSFSREASSSRPSPDPPPTPPLPLPASPQPPTTSPDPPGPPRASVSGKFTALSTSYAGPLWPPHFPQPKILQGRPRSAWPELLFLEGCVTLLRVHRTARLRASVCGHRSSFPPALRTGLL